MIPPSIKLSELPKIELHVHLDGSLGYDAVRILSPETTEAQYLERYVGPERCADLAEWLNYLGPSITLLQSPRALDLAVRSLVKQLSAENVIYAEIRFAPLLHRQCGMHENEVMETVLASFQSAAAQTGLKGGFLLCTLRHFDEDSSLKTASLAQRYAKYGVVGFDLAADEAGHPLDRHVSSFRRAREAGLGITAHAGEAAGPDSVIETIETLSPDRIGHGVRCIEDPRAVEMVREAAVHLEVCPSSNVQTGIYDGIREHPVDQLRSAGVKLGINTDTRAVNSRMTLSQEYRTLVETFDWNIDDFRLLNLDAVAAAFASDEIKRTLKHRIEHGFPSA
jgi:adenosine deaminase